MYCVIIDTQQIWSPFEGPILIRKYNVQVVITEQRVPDLRYTETSA